MYDGVMETANCERLLYDGSVVTEEVVGLDGINGFT